MVVTDPAYGAIAEKLRGAYTFGQLMIGNRPLARACDAHPVPAFFARQPDRLRRVRFSYSLDDHRPQHYVSRLTPAGRPTGFGDFHLAD